MKDYKVVIRIEFPHHEEYVIWEPELYGNLAYQEIDLETLFYDTEKNGFQEKPIIVDMDLYESPQVKEIDMLMAGVPVKRQMIIGTKVFPIRSF